MDVNVGLPDINEAEMLRDIVHKIQSVTPLPLQIDSSDPVAIEAGVRFYNGKPIINSVNGKVVENIKKHNVPLVGLSALMTTTVQDMKKTIEAIKKAGLPCKIMVGGAVLNPEYATLVGADYFAKDAMEAVDIAFEVFAEHDALSVNIT